MEIETLRAENTRFSKLVEELKSQVSRKGLKMAMVIVVKVMGFPAPDGISCEQSAIGPYVGGVA